MSHAKITHVQALSDYHLSATFTNGATKIYDVNPWIEKKAAFKPLKTIRGLFNQVRIDCGGYGIVWNDEIDLDAEEVWQNGYAQ